MTPRQLAELCIVELKPKLTDKISAVCSSCGARSFKQFRYIVKCCRNSNRLYLCINCSNREIATNSTVKAKIKLTKSNRSEQYSENIRQLWKNDEYRQKVTDSTRKACNTTAERTRRSIRAKQLWKNDEYRQKVILSCKSGYVQPEYNSKTRNKIRVATINNWQIKEIAKHYKIGLKACIEWSKTKESKAILQKILTFNKTAEGRRLLSERSLKQLQEGKLKTFGRQTKVSTIKGGEFIVKSSYELKYVEILESDDSVISYLYEPFFIEYEFEGFIYRYTPDFLVQYEAKQELVEIKPEKLVTLPKNQAKFKAGGDQGIAFRVITENELFK